MSLLLCLGLSIGLCSVSPCTAQSAPGSPSTPAAPIPRAQEKASPAAATPLAEALILYRKRDFAAAAEKYSGILKEDPKSSDAYAGLGRVYLKQGNVTKALETVQKGLAISDTPTLHVALGEVLFRQGKISDGEREWVTVINAQHVEPRAFLGLYRVRQCMSMRLKAKAMIDKAHDLDPSDPEIQNAWMGTLTQSKRIVQLEGYLSRTGSGDAEERAGTQKYLEVLKKDAQAPRSRCHLVSKVPSTEIALNRLLLNADHLRGYGLTVAINGRKSNLMVDTGASGILIDRDFAEKAGIKVEYKTSIGGIGDQGRKSGYVGTADSIKIGDVEFQNCPVAVLERRSVDGEEGLIGADVFKDFLVDLDFAEQKLRLGELPQRPGEATVPRGLANDDEEDDDASSGKFEDGYIAPEMKSFTRVYRFGHLILVPTKVGDVPNQLFLLDSGSFDNQISPTTANLITKTYTDQYLSVKGLSGYVKDVSRADKAVLEFGHLRQENQDLTAFSLDSTSNSAGTEISGILGFVVLNLLDLKIDYRDNLVDFGFKPNPWLKRAVR